MAERKRERLVAGLRRGGRAAVGVSGWLGDRLLDVAMWAVNLVRDLPVRIGRLATTLWQGTRSVALAPAEAWRAARRGPGLRPWLAAVPRRAGIWLIVLLFRLLDLVGVPELWNLLMRLAAHVSPLTGEEIGAASAILGPTALRYADVRVAEGGILNLIFKRNQGRAFTTFHTINMPTFGPHHRANFAILLHELVHVYQYERVGGLYVAEAIYAQRTTGYDYGTPDDLQACLANGLCYRNFNREQQAQLVQ
ncbi:MAG: eCIS core domain-containing protein, partial [Anaerolineae bacterium]